MGACIAALVIVAGWLGGIFVEDLKSAVSSLPSALGLTAEWTVGLLAILTVLIMTGRQLAVDKKSQNALDGLRGATGVLEEQLRTMPPPAFMREVGVFVEKNYVLCRKADEVLSTADGPEELENTIRVVLDGIARLAQLFDEGTEDTYPQISCFSLLQRTRWPENGGSTYSSRARTIR